MSTTPELTREDLAILSERLANAEGSKADYGLNSWYEGDLREALRNHAPALIAAAEQGIAGRDRIAELERENAALRQTVNDLEDSFEVVDPRDLDDPFIDFPDCREEEGTA